MKNAFLIFSFVLLLASAVYAQTYMSKTGHAEFESSVPLHSFVGSSDHLVGKINLEESIVDFYLDLTTLDTSNNKRDKDMRETLETEEYPFAEFYGKITSGFDSTDTQPQTVTVQGIFTIHGVKQEITTKGTLQRTSNGLKVNTKWTLNLTDYNIKPPGILFYRVDEEIDISIEALLKPVNE